VGERRIGKSSLLNFLYGPTTRVKHLEKPEQYVFVFIDFQQFRLKSPEELIGVIYSETARQTEGKIEIGLPANYDGLGQACETITGQGYKLIFLFDEFEAVTKNERIGPEFYSTFRSLANSYPISFITASGKNLKEMCASHEISDSPFFNIFTVQYLGALREQDAKDLIAKPSTAASIPLAPLAPAILDMGGLYPFFLQIACSAWFEYLEAEGKDAESVAGKTVPKAVMDMFRQEVEPHFEYILENLPEGERAVMKKLVEGGAASCGDPHADALERKGYLRQTEGEKLVVFSKEFGAFIKRSGDRG
jgi:eukaryotic-like serine/threonine-protein kinase